MPNKLSLDKTEATCQWFDNLCSGETAGGEDVCVPASSPAPLLLRYPVWDMTFSQYGERNGWEVE